MQQPKLAVKGLEAMARLSPLHFCELTDLKLCTSSPSWLCLKIPLDGKSRADALQRRKREGSEKSSQVSGLLGLRLTAVVPGQFRAMSTQIPLKHHDPSVPRRPQSLTPASFSL